MGSFLFWILVFVAIYYLSANFRNNPQNLNNGEFLAFEEAKFLVGLLAKVAKSDGRVNELEANLISEILDDIVLKLGINSQKRNELKQIYNTEKENLSNTYELARQYCDLFRIDADIAVARVSFLLNLAYIDGNFSDSERATIERISDAFGLSRASLQSIINRFDSFYKTQNNEQNLTQKDPYEVLGLLDNADFSEVKKRYRELVKKYHPDILMGRGESYEMIEKSTRKLQEINEAYEMIKRNLGEK